MKEHLNRPGSRSNIKWTTLSWYLPRSKKFNVFRNTESKKLRIEKPLTGEILRSMKCEVKPLVTRSSGSTQEMKGSTESNHRYQTQTRKLVFPGVNKKKPHLQIIYKRNKYTEKTLAHSSSGNLAGACNVLKCLCCIICCVQYTKALFDGTLKRNKPRKKTC